MLTTKQLFPGITQDDLNAAARGLRLAAMPLADLTTLLLQHDKRVKLFADAVIVLACEQMIAAKERVGAQKKEVLVQYAQIDLKRVAHVYSGRNGACMCGCAGKHTYASQHQEWAGKNRGYEVTKDEINNRTVKLIVGKLMTAPGVKKDDDMFVATVDNRIYVAYMKGGK